MSVDDVRSELAGMLAPIMARVESLRGEVCSLKTLVKERDAEHIRQMEARDVEYRYRLAARDAEYYDGMVAMTAQFTAAMKALEGCARRMQCRVANPTGEYPAIAEVTP